MNQTAGLRRTIAAYFLPFRLHGTVWIFDNDLIERYASTYMKRNLIAGSILLAVGVILPAGILKSAVHLGACMLGLFGGMMMGVKRQ